MKSTIARTLSSLLHGTLRGLLRAWVLIVPLVVALSLIRLGQLAYFLAHGFSGFFHRPGQRGGSRFAL
ncbi:MAG: hypothetical protein IPG23_25105 [Burkholderiales bacterium]|nr:hypothetical protein [Burkholderiales bacterium]